MSNHDQPRIVSRFGNDGAYRIQAAKMLATFLHMLQGTPYIYQSEELGMANVKMAPSEYDDIRTLNMDRENITGSGNNHKQITQKIYAKSRDNARTPMQWNTTEHAGFTSGNPWLKVNRNYSEINAEAELKNPNSVFRHYCKLIQMRKEYKVIVYGTNAVS